MWGKGNPRAPLVRMKIDAATPLWRTVWQYLKKFKTELPYDPAMPLLGIYPKQPKTLIRKDTCTPK